MLSDKEIDSKLDSLEKSAQRFGKGSGIIKLLSPVLFELSTARKGLLIIRKRNMEQLLRCDKDIYEEELRRANVGIWLNAEDCEPIQRYCDVELQKLVDCEDG